MIKKLSKKSWERKELLRWNKGIFHHFQSVFIEADITFFLKSESWTLKKLWGELGYLS